MMLAIRIKGPHDRNGNARRLFIVMSDTAVKQVIVDGYGNHKCLHKYGLKWPVTEVIVAAREYNDWIAFGKENDMLTHA